MTADNAYMFGWGDAMQVATLKGQPANALAADIFNCPIGKGPEEYTVPGAQAPIGAYLYLVAWADNTTTQGIIGQFERGGAPLYTGDPAWEVCATGLSYPTNVPGGGPPVTTVNAEIAKCNAGGGSTSTTSAGWVHSQGAVTAGAVGTLVAGEDNSSASGTFPLVCQQDANGVGGIDAAARWMWYRPPGVVDPFRASGTNNTRTFLLFRLRSEDVPIN
jgi:hypothetical protein